MIASFRFPALLVAAGLLIGFGEADAAPGSDRSNAATIDVMTANLYLGADIFRILEAEVPEEIPFKVAEIFGIVQMTDFPERAEGIADAIRRRRPHVIGLQEVSWYRTGEFNPEAINAEETAYDFLELLMEALAARGLDYEVAGVVDNVDVEVPMITSNGLVDLRLTDRDVILVRGDVRAGLPYADNYQTNASFPLAGAAVEFVRGYVMVPVMVRNRSYLFVNTHLETRLEDFGPLGRVYQFAQSLELAQTVNLLNDEVFGDLPVVLVGDLNSDPADVPVPVPPEVLLPFDVLVPPYLVLTGLGYIDTWLLRSGRPESGETCCHDEELNDPDENFYERIDHVLFRETSPSVRFGPIRSEVVNDAHIDKTESGLWLSDHGFVSVSLKQRHLKERMPMRRVRDGRADRI